MILFIVTDVRSSNSTKCVHTTADAGNTLLLSLSSLLSGECSGLALISSLLGGWKGNEIKFLVMSEEKLDEIGANL
jgi:hypothetical protein